MARVVHLPDGGEDDPMAVTDPAGRVRGVEGLRVVDASVFPVVPCANTNFPVLMTAEKMADAILAGRLNGAPDKGVALRGKVGRTRRLVGAGA